MGDMDRAIRFFSKYQSLFVSHFDANVTFLVPIFCGACDAPAADVECRHASNRIDPVSFG
jgi:hypothetical protein